MGRCRGRWLGVAMAVVISGCSVFQPEERPPAPVERPPAPAVVTPPPTAPQAPARPAEPSTAAAWKPLLARAQQAAGRGDYDQALALLERAQRIEPDSGEIYLQLARTHQARGDLTQARATAERGLLYCSGNAQCAALRALTR